MPYKLLDIQKSATVATQTTVSVDGEGKWAGIDQDEEEIDTVVFSGDDILDDDEIIDLEVTDPDLNDGINFEFIESDVEFIESDVEFIESDVENEGVKLDEGVELTEGEIAKRKFQKSIPDDDGFFDCNLDDVDLSVAEVKERRCKLKRGITADSGAGDPVIPRRMVNVRKIVPSAGSKRGLHYVSATNHRIPNVGEANLEFETSEGFSEKIRFQVADVNKVLLSISDRVDHRCRVVFDQDEETGEDISHIFDKVS